MHDFAADAGSFDERELALLRDRQDAASPVVPPLYQTSLFTFASYEEMFETFAGRRGQPVYSRVQNPTVRLFEEKMAVLEGGADAIGFASGMAAISTAVLSVVRPGDRMLSTTNVYPDAYRFFEMVLRDLGVGVDYVDVRDAAAVAEMLPGRALLYLESPTSWTFDAVDLGALATLARRHGVTTIVDNSWATPFFQTPLGLNCDIVVHSASKYISGHSDTVAGVLVSDAARVADIRRRSLPFFGAKLAPFDAWLLVRGLRTLRLRMEHHRTSALEIARRLAEHPDVERVLHPGLAGLPPGLDGTSGLFGFEVSPRIDIRRFCNALTAFQLGVSWGGHESLAIPAEISLAQEGGPNAARFFGVPARLIRLSIGLEPVDFLWRDLCAALTAAEGGNASG